MTRGPRTERITVPAPIARIILERVRDIAMDAATDASLRGQSEIMAAARSSYLRGFQDGRDSRTTIGGAP